MEAPGSSWTPLDPRGCRWISVDSLGRFRTSVDPWTSMDPPGTLWMALDLRRSPFDLRGLPWYSLDIPGSLGTPLNSVDGPEPPWTSVDSLGRSWTSLDPVEGLDRLELRGPPCTSMHPLDLHGHS